MQCTLLYSSSSNGYIYICAVEPTEMTAGAPHEEHSMLNFPHIAGRLPSLWCHVGGRHRVASGVGCISLGQAPVGEQ